MLNRFLEHKYLPFLALLVLGLATRFIFIWYPGEVVFDEVHFGKFVSAYYTHEYYFDIHPPLGKLLIAGFAKFFGFRAGFDFDKIGEGYGNIPYVALRFLPNLAGALIPLAVFGWLLAMGISRSAAFLAGWFLLFDNAYLVQSHFVLVDAFLLLFGFAGLWAFFGARHRGYSLGRLVLAAALLGASFSIKWTGLGFYGLAFVIMLWDYGRALVSRATTRAGIFIGVAMLLYISVFWVHFALLTKSGMGDAFMSMGFQKTLSGSSYALNENVKPIGFLEKFAELNKTMFSANQGLKATHPYSSQFYGWPLMLRPIFYWVKDFTAGTGRIYLLGNPFVWWLSTIGLFAALVLWRGAGLNKWWLYIGYLANMIPFVGVTRVTFLYHYLPALGFAVSILAAWLFGGSSGKWSRASYIFLLGLIFFGFLFFSPLSYGWPLTGFWYKMRVWLPTWI